VKRPLRGRFTFISGRIYILRTVFLKPLVLRAPRARKTKGFRKTVPSHVMWSMGCCPILHVNASVLNFPDPFAPSDPTIPSTACIPVCFWGCYGIFDNGASTPLLQPGGHPYGHSSAPAGSSLRSSPVAPVGGRRGGIGHGSGASVGD